MVTFAQTHDALLAIYELHGLPRETVVDVGRELWRVGRGQSLYASWSAFASFWGIERSVASELWGSFAGNDGPDVIEALAAEAGWSPARPPVPTPLSAMRERETRGFDYVAEHVVRPPRISTGVAPLDDALDGGMVFGTYTVVGGEGGAGKSTLALTAAYFAARAGSVTSLVYSAEMSKQECYDRLLSIHTQRECERFGRSGLVWWSSARESVERNLGGEAAAAAWEMGGAEQAEFVRGYVERFGGSDPVVAAWRDFSATVGRRIVVVDDVTSPEQVAREVGEVTAAGERAFVVVDHIQALEPEGLKDASEYEVVTTSSRVLRQCAKSCRVPMLVASELRNISEKERDRPRISWLRGSGHVGYDAGAVVILTNDGEREGPIQPIVAHVVKNRRGTSNVSVPLAFNGGAQRISRR